MVRPKGGVLILTYKVNAFKLASWANNKLFYSIPSCKDIYFEVEVGLSLLVV